jgi:hypothetical protein
VSADQRAEYVAGLRALADYLEAHPDLPVPYRVDAWDSVTGGDAERAEVDRVAAILGEAPRWSDGTHYEVGRAFGPVVYRTTVISPEGMARHLAAATYSGAVEPEVTP